MNQPRLKENLITCILQEHEADQHEVTSPLDPRLGRLVVEPIKQGRAQLPVSLRNLNG